MGTGTKNKIRYILLGTKFVFGVVLISFPTTFYFIFAHILYNLSVCFMCCFSFEFVAFLFPFNGSFHFIGHE